MRPRLESFSQTSPRVALLALQATRVRLGSHYRSSPVAAMVPASLLRRPGLSRLVRQVRAYAEAAAAPAPAVGPGQMSFTFASPTQVRTLIRCDRVRVFQLLFRTDPGSEFSSTQVSGTHSGVQTHALFFVWSGSEPSQFLFRT